MPHSPRFDENLYSELRGASQIGTRVHFSNRSISTMTDARIDADLKNNDSCGDAYLAYEQTQGRGRFERTWVSAPGAALLVTYHLCTKVGPHVPLISAAGGLATAEAIEATTGLLTQQKWPNDVLVDGQKLAGILASARQSLNGKADVFLGIGINLFEEATTGLPEPDRQKATTIQGAGISPPGFETLLATLSRLLESKLQQLELDPVMFLDEWRGRLVTIGQRVRLSTPNQEFEGIATSVTDLGELTLRLDDGSIRSFSAGDVTTA